MTKECAHKTIDRVSRPSSAIICCLSSALCAILLILSFPRFNLEYLAWFAFIPLFAVLEGECGLKALRTGFVTGLMFFLGLIYWVTHSMTNYGGVPLPVGIVILALFAGYLAIYFALFAWILSLFSEKDSPYKWIGAPFIWTSLELIRTHFLTGFPWGTLGYSQFKTLPVIQISDITGVYGVSFLIVMVNVSIYLAIDHFFMKRGQRKFIITYCMIALSFVYTAWVYGLSRIGDNAGDGVLIKAALVQGNVDQGVKWNPAYKNATLDTYIDLTMRTMAEGPDIIIWPESALPFFLQERGEDQDRVINVSKETRSSILSGSPAYDIRNRKVRSFNRAYLISPDGSMSEYYDKMHLVPYGEYVPLKQLFPFIEKMVVGIGDFSRGSEYKVFELLKGRFSALICYEMIFPNLVRQFVNRGADFLVNITNDAWFGKTAAPYQHISMITFRSVENRVPVVRAANTGISGIIDSIGKIIMESDIFERSYMVGDIRLAKQGKTFYTRYGDLFAYMCVLVCAGILFKIKYRDRGAGGRDQEKLTSISRPPTPNLGDSP